MPKRANLPTPRESWFAEPRQRSLWQCLSASCGEQASPPAREAQQLASGDADTDQLLKLLRALDLRES